MKIIELFKSIQGEGNTVGYPAIFIRFPFCNLDCEFCDTKYIRDLREVREISLEQIVEYIKNSGLTRIVFTGGEPLMRPNRDEIIKIYNELEEEYYQFEIETNGTFEPLDEDLPFQYNVSPKLFNSHNKNTTIKIDILRQLLNRPSAFKFVISNKKDLEEANKIIKEVKIPNHLVWIMPEGKEFDDWKKRTLQLLPDILKLNYNLSPRLQVILWGTKRGV